MREGWKTVKLQDCCIKIGSGATPRGGKEAYLDDGPYALIRSQNILDFFFSYSGLAFIDKAQADQLSNVEVKENDVLLNITGDSVARVCQVPNSLLPARVNQHVSIIRPDESRLTPEFLKYFLLNPNFKNHMLGLASVGGTRNALTKGMIEDFDIDLPPLETQSRIATILSSLDEKIELNRQTNQTLEAIAQTLFKEWFMDFNFPGATGEMQESELGPIPAGWKAGKLGDICQNFRRTTHPKDIESNIPYVGLEHIPRKSMSLSSWGASEDVGSQKSHFNKFNILFGKLRPYFHKVCIAPVDGICSTDILVIEPLKKEYFSFCLNHLFSNELISYVSGIADGTRMPRVDWKSISEYEIVIPPDNLMQEFENLTIPIYEEMIHNNEESASLTATRDSLLPKLMNGEIEPGAGLEPAPTRSMRECK